MTWIPVISGVFFKPVQTSVLPRIGESVLLPLDKDGKPAADGMSYDERVFRVVDVRHYIAYRNRDSFEDVHLEEIK